MPTDGASLTRPVAIIAGGGSLPLILADSLARQGRDSRILALRGFADPATRRRAGATIGLVDVRGALATLAGWNASGVVLAGQVDRPGPAALLGALRGRDEIRRIIGRGDDHLLRAVASLLEENGFPVLGLHELAPELLAPEGVLGRLGPNAEEEAAIAVGRRLLADLSTYDIGQAAIVCGERVAAIEGPEGTDRMLARVGGFRGFFSRVRLGPGGVLVKMPKRGQDLRLDLPAIGPRTVAKAAKAGLRGIAVGAGGALVLERERTVAEADRLGLFLVGIAP